MSRPNILFIATDQLRGDAVAYANGLPVITPALDALAKRSTIFTRCISNSPLCVPARAAIMTGQLPHQNGVWNNARAGDPTGRSHVRALRDEGYFTAVVGKTHLWRTGVGPKPGLHAKTMDHILDAWGFKHRVEVNDPIGTGSQGCAYTDYAEKHGFVDAHRKYINDWIDEIRSRNPTPWAQPPSPAPKFKDIDSFIGRTAIEWLRTYDQSQPFYLQVQFTGPHDPYDGPTDFREMYRDVDIGTGNTETLQNPPIRLKNRLESFSSILRATESQRREWRVNYFANISLIDYWIGKLIQTLDERDLAENTWIFFTSDHGEMLGDLGLWGKTVYFEPSIHVPLLIHPPRNSIRSYDHLVQQIDIPNTILDIADTSGFAESLGRSLKPIILEEKAQTPTQYVFSELGDESTVITDRYKLTIDATTREALQLLDLVDNPTEDRNLIGDATYQSIQEELLALGQADA